MTDIHCHILPDYDDGAEDTEQALSMAKMAAESGVTDIVATPHFTGSWSYEDEITQIKERFAQFKRETEAAGIPVNIYCGAEILCTDQTPFMAEEKKLPTINGTNYLLLEFRFDESAAFMNEILSGISKAGFVPVIAHPERYGAVQRDLRLAERWFSLGFVLQLNKGSILGAFGSRARAAANALISRGLAHIIASDAHSDEFRTPHMGAIAAWLEENCDDEYTGILLERNPRRLINGEPMVPVY